MLRRFHYLTLLAVLGLTCTSEATGGMLAGRMEGNTYVSPTGQFKIPSPVLPELGGTITDTENAVVFSDSYNTHVSIACFPLDATQRWESETRDRRDYLLYFFSTFVLTDFQKRFPGSHIESARYLPELQGGTMITFALLPGGSNFEDKSRVTNDPAEHPITAKRGTLLLLRPPYLYIISTELAERATQPSTYQLTAEQENLRLTERLIALVNQLVFTSAAKSRS